MEEENDRSTASGVIVQSNGIIVHRLSTMNDSLPGMIKNLKAHRRSSLFQNVVWSPELSPHCPSVYKFHAEAGLVNSVKVVLLPRKETIWLCPRGRKPGSQPVYI